jgi:glucokinase
MTADRLALGVDIGGTKVAFALVNAQGQAVATHHLPTHDLKHPPTLYAAIAHTTRQLAEGRPLLGVGIGVPGHVAPQTGVVRNAVNLGWDEVPLAQGVSMALDGSLPVWVRKDAEAAALGEAYFGAGQDCVDFLFYAIGTGLGGAAVVDGEVVGGANSYAMEVGHFGLYPDGRLCACGLRGCPEMYIAGVGLQAALRDYAPAYPDSPLKADSSLSALLEAGRAGDPLAGRILSEALACFVQVMGYAACLFNPARIIVGGGLGHAAADYFVTQAEAAFHQRVLPATRHNVRVVESRLESSAVGAASLVWHGLEQTASLVSI